MLIGLNQSCVCLQKWAIKVTSELCGSDVSVIIKTLLSVKINYMESNGGTANEIVGFRMKLLDCECNGGTAGSIVGL